MPKLPLGPPSDRGTSCARTILAALADTGLRPEVLHIVGVSTAELSLDFRTLAAGLPPGARVLLIGPHALESGANEQLLGPEELCGLRVSVFPHTYQRYTTHFPLAEDPQFVAMFHPGLDIHFFTWYSCIKQWADAKIPVLVTAYKMPEGYGEKPATVQRLLEILVGTGGGAGMWVLETENEHSVDDGVFNAGYFVFLGSQGVLSALPDDIYVHLYTSLKELGHPFAPRVGYLDVEETGTTDPRRPELLAAIAEGAQRGAKASEADCSDELAEQFATTVLDLVLGNGAGMAWQRSGHKRAVCPNCGEGYDSAKWHAATCPAAGRKPLAVGDRVVLAQLPKAELNGRQGVLERFDREKQRWVVGMGGGRRSLWKAANLDPDPEAAESTAPSSAPAASPAA